MITAFTSLHPGGATFLDWSWHWLKGHDSYWNMSQGWLPLIDNPLKEARSNAHLYQKNHPDGFENWQSFLELAEQECGQSGKDVSFYPFFSNLDIRLGDRLEEFVEQINILAKKKVEVVMIKKTNLFPYGSERTEYLEEHDIRSFLKENPEIDGSASLNKIRELASIRLIPQQRQWLKKIDMAFDKLADSVVVIHDTDLIDKTEMSLELIFKRQGLSIDQSRWSHWLIIQKKWKEQFLMTKKFISRLPMILKDIINGNDTNIRHLKIGFLEEVLIMAHLMKDHGARLLLPGDDFPKNTADLHRYLKNHKI